MSISIPQADFTPQLTGYTGQGAFRFWCQKVLPIVYDDSLSYYELLNKVVVYLNNVISDVANVEDNIGKLDESYVQLQGYVNEHISEVVDVVNTFTDFIENYFDNLDVQEEINNKLDSMASDGSLSAVLRPIIALEAPDIITRWLSDHVTPTSPIVDNTLTISGAAADAKTTGDKIDGLMGALGETTRNLWLWGDVSTTPTSNFTITDVNIPAGTYTISALPRKNSGYDTRFVFYKNYVAVGNVLANPKLHPGYRNSISFTLEEPASIIVVQFAPTSSILGESNVEDIQLEEGTDTTEYIPHVTATDYEARQEIDSFKSEANSRMDATDALLDDVIGTTNNLWRWGNQEVTGVKRVTSDAAIPAGTYTLSALINKSENGNIRMVFYKNSVAVENLLANPYIAANRRNSRTFTLAEQADIIQVYSSTNSEGTIPAVWTDIQIEPGQEATPYVPHLTAIDYITRTESHVYDVVKSLEGTYTGDISQTITLALAKNVHHPAIICLDAMYTQDTGVVEYPYLYSYIYTDRNLERDSMRYKIGEKNEYKLISIRTVPYIWDNRDVNIYLKVPTGCTLTIRHAYCYFERSKTQTTGGVQFHAHDGACGIAPPQTLASYKMAYDAGYNSAIVIPKITSDGVWFAYHDDTFIVDSTILRNPDGTRIVESEYDGLYFNQIPWSYLAPLVVGNFGGTFADVHLMKLTDFFEFCAKTGVAPVFSMHPRYGIQSTAVLESLKNLVNKYGLLDKLIIKMPLVMDNNIYTLSNFTTIFSVFGNDVARYEVDAVNGMDNPESVIDLFDDVSSEVAVPKVIEWWITQLLANESLVSSALTAGYAVSCAQTSYTDISGETLSAFSSEIVKKLMDLGVTEFTDQYNTSNGLYW